MMKRRILEIILILSLSAGMALLFNHFSQAGISLREKIAPPSPATAVPVLRPGIRDFPEVDAEFVLQIVQTGGGVIVDARLPVLFATGHLPGARNLPVGQFEKYWRSAIGNVALNRMLLVYCSGGACTDSQALAEMLSKSGFSVIMIYRGGLDDWLSRGYEIEK
jgi:rhodanese-related sulfurtransferase